MARSGQCKHHHPNFPIIHAKSLAAFVDPTTSGAPPQHTHTRCHPRPPPSTPWTTTWTWRSSWWTTAATRWPSRTWRACSSRAPPPCWWARCGSASPTPSSTCTRTTARVGGGPGRAWGAGPGERVQGAVAGGGWSGGLRALQARVRVPAALHVSEGFVAKCTCRTAGIPQSCWPTAWLTRALGTMTADTATCRHGRGHAAGRRAGWRRHG